MTTFFISDIHLHAEAREQTRLLLDFLQHQGPTADAIYILGDLFAIWLGDDLDEPYSLELIATLRQLTAQNIPVYFMRGNRDFLVGKKFCLDTGCKLLPDPYKINLYGQEVLLTHGDLLCTLDHSYQKFRRIVQNPVLKNIFLLLPISWRKKLGMWVKGKAKRAPQNPAAYDVAPDTVAVWFDKYKVDRMIHGHTHRPAVHTTGVQQRFVMGDWTARSARILVASGDGVELQDLLDPR